LQDKIESNQIAEFKKKFKEPSTWTPPDFLIDPQTLKAVADIKTATHRIIKNNIKLPNLNFENADQECLNYSIFNTSKSNLSVD